MQAAAGPCARAVVGEVSTAPYRLALRGAASAAHTESGPSNELAVPVSNTSPWRRPARGLFGVRATQRQPVGAPWGPGTGGRALSTKGDAAGGGEGAAAVEGTAAERMEAVRRRVEEAGFSDGVGSSVEDGSAEEASGEVERLRHRLLRASLEHVPTHGWTNAAIVAGAGDIGLSPAVSGILPRGEGDLVAFFVDRCNGRLADLLSERGEELRGMRVRDRVGAAVRMRLEMLGPHMDTWPQAMGVMAQPQNAPTALKQMAMMVDDIWQHAGDTSTDHNWYTKRAILAGVYTATELYMLTDKSEGHADTWDALSRRLDDSMALGKSLGSVASQLAPVLSAAADQLNAVLKGRGVPRPPKGPLV